MANCLAITAWLTTWAWAGSLVRLSRLLRPVIPSLSLFRTKYLALFSVLIILSACRTPNSSGGGDDDAEEVSQVKSLIDDQYILLMKQVDRSESEAFYAQNPKYIPNPQGVENPVYVYQPEYQFVTCRLERRNTAPGSSPEDGVSELRGALPGWWLKFLHDYRDFKVLTDSCVSTYLGEDGEPLTLVPSSSQSNLKLYVTKEKLKRIRDQIDREQRTHLISGFGFGAMFSSLSAPFGQALNTLIPAGPRAGLMRFFARMSMMWGVPHAGINQEEVLVVPNVIEGMTTQASRVFVYVRGMNLDIKDRPWELNAADITGTAASAAAGYATARMIIKRTSAVGGPWGAAAGFVVVPFATSTIITLRHNVAKDVLENLQQAFSIHDLNAMGASAKYSPEQVGKTSSTPLASKALGESLLYAGWASDARIKKYCYPGTGILSEPVCADLEPPQRDPISLNSATSVVPLGPDEVPDEERAASEGA